MSDLTEFLLARIAEDEEFATRAASAPWKRTLLGVDGVAGDRDQTPIPVAREVRYWHGDHIARWDPSRVLADCEAKRRIVEQMVNEVKDARRRPGWTLPDSEMDERGRDYRVGFENARAHQLPDVLDRTDRVLRLLALPYADHPDYDEAWRP